MISRHARVHDFFAVHFAHAEITATSSSPFPTRDDVQVLFPTFIATVIVAYMGIHTCYVCEYACLVSGTKIPAVCDCVRA